MRIEGSDARVEGGEVRFSVPHRQPGTPVRGPRRALSGGRRRDPVRRDGGRRSRARPDRRVDVDVDEGVVEVWNGDATRLARLKPGESWNSSPRPPKARRPTRPARRTRPPTSGAAARSSRREPTPSPRAVDTSRAIARRDPHLALTSPAGRCASRAVATPSREAAESPRRRPAQRWPPATRPARCSFTERSPRGPARSAENASYEIGQDPEREARPAGSRGGRLAALPVATTRRHPARRGGRVDHRDAGAHRRHGRGARRRRPTSCAAVPTASGAARSRALAGDLYRARGDCRHALGAYQLALGASRARDVVEAATFHRAACLVRLGDASGADAARAYLRALPDGRFRRQATELVEQATTKR